MGAKTTELCGKQCNAFRGHSEKVAINESNCGNLLTILKIPAQTIDDYQNHLTSPVAKNATLLTTKTSNWNY